MRQILLAIWFILTTVNPVYAKQAAGKVGTATVNVGTSAPVNYIKNPSAYINAYEVTTSNAAVARDTDSADKLDGIASFTCDASAQNGYCAWATETIQEGDKTGNCEAKMQYKGDASLYKFAITDTTNYLSYSSVLSNATDWTSVSINYPCGSTRDVRLVQTESGTGAAVNIGRIYYGSATNTSNVAQASLIGTAYFATTGSCFWGRTNTSLGAFTTTAACPGPTVEFNSGPGVIQTTDADLPKVTVNDLPPGDYVVEVTFVANGDNATASFQSFAVSDGTTTTGHIEHYTDNTSTRISNSLIVRGQFSYTAPGNRTFELYGAASANGIVVGNNNRTERTYFRISRFPTSSELAVRSNTTPWYVDATIGGASPSLGSSAATSWTSIENGSLSLVNSTGAATAWIPCASGTSPSGLTCSAANESIGIYVNIPTAGTYMVCATANQYIQLTNGAIESYLRIVETSASDPTSQTQVGTDVTSARAAFAGTGEDVTIPHKNCSELTFSSNGYKTIRLMYKQLAGSGTVSTNAILADRTANQGSREVKFSMWPITQQMPMPLLVGSVTSNSSGMERVERAKFTNTGSCAISSQSGSWLGTPTDPGAGNCGVVINSGIFSATPTCVCTAADTASSYFSCVATPSSTTLVTVGITAVNTGTATDRSFDMICMGPR